MNESTHKVRTAARGGPRPSPPSAAPGAGTRPAIRHILRGPRPQARLEVGRADDPAEREAEQVAEALTGKSAPAVGLRVAERLQRRCACGEEETLRRKAVAEAAGTAEAAAQAARALEGGGRPLDPAVRADLEPRFGYDFSGVRVHTDSAAAAGARLLRARAYTLGEHIAFAPGQYQPHSEAGRRLLAHELTHVIQQGGAPGGVIRRAADFNSTMEICHRLLRSRTFRVRQGGLRVTADARWTPSDEWAGSEPPVCGRPVYHMTLEQIGVLWNSEYGTCEFDMGRPVSRVWNGLPEDEYRLTIWTNNTNPNCCLRGNIEVREQASAPGPSCTRPPPGALEILHTVLDAAGFIPALGVVPDAINTGLYLIEGDWTNAGISAVAMVPLFGDAASLVRTGRRAVLRVSGEAVERIGREGLEAGMRELRAARRVEQGVGRGSLHGVTEAEIERALGQMKPAGERLELIPHGAAREARQARGLSGRAWESAHGAPRAALRNLRGYDPHAALTRLLPKRVHRSMDRYWQQVTRRLARQGRRTWTAQEMFETVAESIRRTEGLSAAEKSSHILRLQDEIFIEWGLRPGDLVRLPYAR